MKTRYVIISPVRDEAQHLEKTIRSVVRQTIKPVQWILVNDGSVDATPDIIKHHLPKHSWMTLVNRTNRGYRKLGGGVVDAFNEGLRHVRKPWDFIVKLDGDVSFGPGYFSALLGRFHRDPQLGIASGQAYVPYGKRLVWERTNAATTRGASKMYCKDCFEDMPGLVPALGWDATDELIAQMQGWKTQSFREVRFIHWRPMASSTGWWLRGKYREGYIAWYLGYLPLFALARGVRQLHERPYIVGGLALIAGFVVSGLRGLPQYPEKRCREFLQQRQLRRLRNIFGQNSRD